MSQNLEKIGEEDAITISGGMNLNSVFYNAKGIASRRDPFNWFASGNLNINIIDFNMPVSYSYSNHKGKFTQPFNQFSLSPTYKWAKAQIGYSSVSFSPYSISGHLFMGGAVELSPRQWKFSVLYGRFKKAVQWDPELQNETEISYQRMGCAIKAGYEKNGYSFFLSGFAAGDDPASLQTIPVNSPVLPMENLVISSGGKTKVTNTISMESEIALSGMARGYNFLPGKTDASKYLFPDIQQLIRSADYFFAWKAAVNYSVKKFNLKLMHEHVDPGYATLGTYFINNDLENYTLSPSFILCKGKLNISINSGFQRNNLDDSKLASTWRWVGSASVNFTPNDKWNVNAAYSNFTSYTKNRTYNDPYFSNSLDTLNFYQVSRSANVSLSKRIGKKTIQQFLLLTASYSESHQQHGNFQSFSVFPSSLNTVPTINLNSNLGYTLQFLPSRSSLSVGTNSNYSSFPTGKTIFFGPNISYAHPLFYKKVKFSASSAFNQTWQNEVSTGFVLNNRISLSYAIPLAHKQKINSSFSCNLVSRIQNEIFVRELTGTLNFSYNF
ncbi:MAG: hypothetical protein ACOZCO_08390 [Bacteroidota bacterium]